MEPRNLIGITQKLWTSPWCDICSWLVWSRGVSTGYFRILSSNSGFSTPSTCVALIFILVGTRISSNCSLLNTLYLSFKSNSNPKIISQNLIPKNNNFIYTTSLALCDCGCEWSEEWSHCLLYNILKEYKGHHNFNPPQKYHRQQALLEILLTKTKT